MKKQNFNNKVDGFSKFSKEEKIAWVKSIYFHDNQKSDKLLKQYWNENVDLQKIHDEFAENTISNF
jgi:hydroxymethylglutaryl-CoA reductase